MSCLIASWKSFEGLVMGAGVESWSLLFSYAFPKLG